MILSRRFALRHERSAPGPHSDVHRPWLRAGLFLIVVLLVWLILAADARAGGLLIGGAA
jgi:hypothetical protein